MTRLITEWLTHSKDDMEIWDTEVESITGLNAADLARNAAAAWMGISEKDSEFIDVRRKISCGVVPVTAGLGKIGGFSHSVAAVLEHLGVNTILSETSDVEGVWRCIESGAEIIFMADDNRFIALNARHGAIGENDKATAWGYASALHHMAGGLNGRDVLLLGCGRVGHEALNALKYYGAKIYAFDKDREASASLAGFADGIIESPDRIRKYPLIFDATDEGGWLSRDELNPDVIISAPGLPLSFDDDCASSLKNPIFHDTLHTGVAVMLFMAMQKGTREDTGAK